MDWIDEKGRLFGRVNVIDALVVLLVLAVVAAGAAFVLGPDEESNRVTQHATVTLATQPAHAGALVSTGTVEVDGTPVEMTDVYRTPADDGNVTVRLRLAFEGRETEAGFRAANRVIRYGAPLTLTTDAYEVVGTVSRLADDGRFETATLRTTVTATLHDEVAGAIATGDTRTLGGTEVARVTGVERTEVNATHSRVRVEVALRTLTEDGTPTYAGDGVRLGRRLPVVTDRYEFTGEVVAVERDG